MASKQTNPASASYAGTAAEREAGFRRRFLSHLLGDESSVDEFGVASFESLREEWLGPQCAILELLLDRLNAERGLTPSDLQPFLEIGAFTAHLSGHLATKHGMRGYCGDLDAGVIERSLREILPRLGMTADGLEAVRADASRLEFESDSLGLVFCYSTLHHFEDPAACLREIRRVLRPGGVFLCANEPIQPAWRRSRKPVDCPEVRAGIIENVYRLKEYDSIVGSVFEDFKSMPYDALRMPRFIPPALQPFVSRLVNGGGRGLLRRFVYSRFGGQDYSAIGFKADRGRV